MSFFFAFLELLPYLAQYEYYNTWWENKWELLGELTEVGITQSQGFISRHQQDLIFIANTQNYT